MKIDQMINFKYQSRKKRVLIYLITKFGTKIFYLIFLKIEEIEKKKIREEMSLLIAIT